MNNEEFKKFIKNRTVEDIMEDYAEQHDEWEIMVERKNGYVTRFMHGNGKHFFCLQYDGECGIALSKLKKKAVNKTISEQMEFFYVKTVEGPVKLSEYEGTEKLLLKGDILIGIVLQRGFNNDILLFGESVLDENGNKICLKVNEETEIFG